MTEPNYELQIRIGQRAGDLLKDEVVQALFAERAKVYTDEWKAGKTVEAREAAWAKSAALEDIQADLRAIRDRGTAAAHAQNREQRRAAPTTGRASK